MTIHKEVLRAIYERRGDIDESIGVEPVDCVRMGYGPPGPCNIRAITDTLLKHNMDISLEEFKDPADTVFKYVKLSDRYTELKNKRERLSLSLPEWDCLRQWLLLLKY
jgi:hypothetical protein